MQASACVYGTHGYVCADSHALASHPHFKPSPLSSRQWSLGVGYTAIDYQVALLLSDKNAGESALHWGDLMNLSQL